MSPLERGFKSWAERLSVGVRRDLGLAQHAPLPMEQLAEYLGAELVTPHEINGLSPEALRQLLVVDPSGWSAVTLSRGERTVVIYNPRHSDGRHQSNIAHELAHLLLEHEPSKVILSTDGSIVMRTFDAEQEDEANWLAGCLLLPRVCLQHAVRRKFTSAGVAAEFGVSTAMAEYRLRVTGVLAQARRERALRGTR